MNSHSKLFAISDLHLDHKGNWQALMELQRFDDDWLILGGDVCETADQLTAALEFLVQRFSGLIWVPGNHELWVREGSDYSNSIEKYQHLVQVCRDFGVLTPEDPYRRWTGDGGDHLIVPLHLLYDYSFRPDEVAKESAIQWAMESGILCADEKLIKPFPHSGIDEWCAERIDLSLQRLREIENELPMVLVNHFPLRYDLVRIKRIPRFSIWCGTELTHTWHQDFSVSVVVSGHLHVRATDYRDGVRFEEVSLGYPRDWRRHKGIHHYLRQILPAPQPRDHSGGTIWWF